MSRVSNEPNEQDRTRVGASASDITVRGAHEATPEMLSTRELGQVNEHQDERMAVQSFDGRSPTHWQRSPGWRLLALGFGLVVGLIIIVAMIYGVSGATAIRYAVVLLALLSIGGMPIWVLINWRGVEERDARRKAVHEQGGQSLTE